MLIESFASTTYVSGPKFTYYYILVTAGLKLRLVVGQALLISSTVTVNMKDADIFTPEPTDVS